MRAVRRYGLTELRVRGAQAAHVFAERQRWSSLAKLPSDRALLSSLDLATPERTTADALLGHFRDREHPTFFQGLADRDATVASLRARWPDAGEQIRKRADRLLGGRFDVLGLTDLSFGDPIDWQREPIAGKRPPMRHWSQVNYLDPTETGDKKIIWELNRHQHFVTLGQAYWLTGDERYAEGFVAQLSTWMDQNPPKLGINWASSLEVAFRSISWLWAIEFFKEAPAFSPGVFARALKYLYVFARHVETYLSTYFSPNTHLTGEGLALLYLGTILPEFRAAERWRATGRQILLAETERQIHRDGVYFERSTYYQRYTTDFCLHWLLLERAHGKRSTAFTQPSVTKLELLLDHLMYITRPDGTTPLIGDDDGGRLLMLGDRASNDFRDTLSTGTVLLQRSDLKFVAAEAAPETLWLLGSAGLAEFDALTARAPKQKSKAFTDGGFYVMRDGWSAHANYMLIDGGSDGSQKGAHAHASALAFDLAAQGQTILVDPGTYTYTGSQHWRDWFRSSSAHNTLTVDGASSSIPAGPFSWTKTAHCHTRSWLSRNRFDYFAGEHDGFQSSKDPVRHSRAVLFLKDGYWVIWDHAHALGAHQHELRFHCDIGITAHEFAAGGVLAGSGTNGDASLHISSFVDEGAWRHEEAPVSHCYGDMRPASVLVFAAGVVGDYDAVTFLIPHRASTRPPQVREIEATGGRAFEAMGDHGYDVVLIRSDPELERCETARIVADFEWTWMHFPNDSATIPDELVLVGGQNVELDGKELLRSARPASYVVARRVGDRFRIETEAGIRVATPPFNDFEPLANP